MKISPVVRCKGLSLVELMIAVAISVVLLAGVIQIFTSSKQAYRATEGYARLQENGRYAIDYLSKYIRLAGHHTGNNEAGAAAAIWEENTEIFPVPNNSVNFPSDTAFTPNAGQVIFGIDGNNGLSDTIYFRYLPDDNGLMDDCLSQFNIAPGSALNPNNVTDFWVRFRINQGTTNGVVQPGGLQCSQIATQLGGVPAFNGTATLVDNIINMQIVYGIDTNGDLIANQYVNATAVGNWNTVVSVRIALLMITPDNIEVATTTQTYALNDVTMTQTDRRRRKRFVTTINLRNLNS